METTKRWMIIRLGLALTLATPLGVWAQAGAPAAAADPTALLKAIPADATAFVSLRNVKELDEDVQTTWKNLKLPEGVVPSLVDWIRGSLNLGEQFNAGGGMALVITSLAEVKTVEEIENHLAIVFPATDAEAMAKSMGGEKDGEVIKLELFGDPSVAAAKPGFLVIAKEQNALKSVMQAKGGGVFSVLPPDRQKAFAQSDIFAWANFRSVSKELREAASQKLSELDESGGPEAAIFMALQQGNMEQFKKFLDEGQEIALGASLDPKKGISLNFAMVMKPDSDLGKQMAAMKPTTGPLLVGLPDEPTIGAIGTVSSPNTEEQVRSMFDNLLKAEGIEEKVDKAKLTQVRDLLAQVAGSMQQFSMGVSGLPAEGGEGMIAAALVGTVKNSDQFKKQARELFTAGKDVIVDAAKKSGEPEEAVKSVADAIQWKENAEKVGSANVDHITFDLSKLPDTDADTVDQVKKIIGKEGVLIRVASVDPTHVVVTFGGGAKRFENVAGLAAKGEAPLTANADIKKVADRLPAGPRLAEGYLNVDHLIATVMNIANELGSPSPFPIVMRNSAPVAFVATKAGTSGQQGEVLIPIELLRSTADTVRPFLQMMMGGPGNEEAPPVPTPEGGKLE